MAERDDLDVTTSFEGDLIALRRELHRIPEVGLQLPKTQAMVLDAVAGLPLEVSTGKEPDLGGRRAARVGQHEGRNGVVAG